MLNILKKISEKALLLADCTFTDDQKRSVWLGNEGATIDNIVAAEERLKIKLPADYVEFIQWTNGFAQPTNVGCSFLPIDKIDYLHKLDEDLVEIWAEQNDDSKLIQSLKAAILVGGLNEEQYFLLIPPLGKSKKWGYWKFANWIPGEEKFTSLEKYFTSELSFLKKETKVKNPKNEIDYSLRDALFTLNWANVYAVAKDFILQYKRYLYCQNQTDIYDLLFISAAKENKFEELEIFLQNQILLLNYLSDDIAIIPTNAATLDRYLDAVRNRISFPPRYVQYVFSEKENPKTLDDIEKQIIEWRKDLLKEKNKTAKVDYQLYFLFSDGSSTNFMSLYENHYETVSPDHHLRAAVVYVTLQQIEKAREAIRWYFKWYYNMFPLEPFLCEILLPIIDKDLIDSLGMERV